MFTKFVHIACIGTHLHQIRAYRLHRYIFTPNSCISLAPVHIYTKFVHIACIGTYLHHVYHGQSESVLKDGRAQDVGV